MSSLTFGPPVYLDGPLPVRPPRSLLTIPGVLQPPGDERWMNGAAVWGYPEDVPLLWDPCGGGTYETKSDESNFSTPDFAAFALYQPVTCSMFTVASDPDGFAERAERVLDATASYGLEYALSQGLPLDPNPFLADSNVQVLASGAAVSVAAGFAYLEEAIGETGRAGMIHATPGAVSYQFSTFPVFEQDKDSTLYTALGTPVSAGGGYKGATPFGQSDAAAGQSWIYATGPVKAYLARETTLNIRDVLDRSENLVTFRAERYALVEWDTSLQAAVLVDWTP